MGAGAEAQRGRKLRSERKMTSKFPVGKLPAAVLAEILARPAGGGGGERREPTIQQIDGACRALGASLVGGHTEVTIGLERPIVVGCLLGEVDKQALITTQGARPGEAVLLAGGVPLEGAAVTPREK